MTRSDVSPAGTDSVLSVRGLGKYYREHSRARSRLREVLTGRRCHAQHWVFRGLSFDISRGESVGVIGRNGAGKSTLLRVLTGGQMASEGEVVCRGRVSAILDLGIGLHADFTGRENARQMVLAQGVPRSELASLVPRIEAFAEIGAYFDAPLHTYSSGMQMRLGFSAATVLRPDVLIVDEALAVGDAYFQHKCYERLTSLRESGTAVLIVSHDPGAIRSLCSRALLLHQGQLVESGPPSQVLETYNLLLSGDADLTAALGGEAAGVGRRAGSGEVRIDSVELLQAERSTRSPVSGRPVVLRVQLDVRQSVDALTLGVLIRDRLGNDMFGTNTALHGLELDGKTTGSRLVEWDIHGFHLGPGHYSLTVAAHRGASHQAGNYDWWDRCLTFQVLAGASQPSIGPCALDVAVHGRPAAFPS